MRRVQQPRLLSSGNCMYPGTEVQLDSSFFQDNVSSVAKSVISGRHCFTVIGVWRTWWVSGLEGGGPLHIQLLRCTTVESEDGIIHLPQCPVGSWSWLHLALRVSLRWFGGFRKKRVVISGSLTKDFFL